MNKKIFLSCLLLLPVVAFAISTAAISPVNTIALTGATNVSVPIFLANNDSISVFQFRMGHTSKIIFRDIETTSRMVNATIEYKVVNSTILDVAVLVPENITAGSGNIMNMKFDVNSSAFPGLYTLDIYDVMAVNYDSDVEITTYNAIFTIL